MEIISQDGLRMFNLEASDLKIVSGENYGEESIIFQEYQGGKSKIVGKYKTAKDCKLVFAKILDALHLQKPFYIMPLCDDGMFYYH